MARILSSVVGHRETIERLLDAKVRGVFPTTLLFTGPEGVGRSLIARGLAQALCCDREPDGCGECGSCIRIEKNQSESLRLVTAEKNMIKIEQSREILDFLSLRSISGRRVVIFDGAETLNHQAANALLKVLEEPPEGTIFILIARSPNQVLPTVLSRAVHVAFHPLSVAELASKVRAPQWALEAAHGSFHKLADLLNSTESRENAIEMFNWWFETPQAYLRPTFRERVKDRELALQLARDFQGFFRDITLVQSGIQSGLSFPDQRELFKKADELGERVDNAFSLAVGLERELSSGSRDSLLAFEEFWIRSHA